LKKIAYIVFLLSYFSFVGKTQDTLLMEVIERSDTTIVNELLQNADTSQTPANTLQYLLKAQNYLEKENKPLELFDIYFRIGNIYHSEKLDDRALPFYQKANRLPSPPILENQKIKLLNPIAESYFNMGRIDSSLITYDEELAYFQKENNYNGILKTLQQKVNVFLKIKNYRMALDLNLKIKLLAEERKDKRHLAIISNNIGYNYNFLGEYDKALKYFLNALELHSKSLDKNKKSDSSGLDLAILNTNIGIAYNNLNDSKNAINFLLKAQKVNDPKQSGHSDAYIQHLIASIYLNNGDTYDALKINDIAINDAKKNNDLRTLSDTYRTAAKIHENLYDHELALDYYQQHFALRDSFALEEKFRRQQLLQQQLLLEKSEKEIHLLLINEAVQDQEITTLQFQTKFLEAESEKLKLNSEKIKLEAN